MFNPGDSDLIEAVSTHVETHVAPVDAVFHEIVSDDLHIDVHWVQPSGRRRYHALVTSGMSERPMSTPDEMAQYGRAELVILLDPAWQLSEGALEDESGYWPIRLLKSLARFPFEHDTWLGYGHTVATGDPPVPYAPSTELCACVVLPPLSLGEDFWRMERPGHPSVYFWSIIPIYREELELKMRSGADALMEAMDRTRIDDVVRQTRPRAGTRRRWLGLI